MNIKSEFLCANEFKKEYIFVNFFADNLCTYNEANFSSYEMFSFSSF
jgi:hypothetical protein